MARIGRRGGEAKGRNLTERRQTGFPPAFAAPYVAPTTQSTE